MPTSAADMMRFGGANQTALWKVFAQRGMGVNASYARMPRHRSDARLPSRPRRRLPETVKFRVLAADEGNAPITNAKVYVGRYEAGATPIADTITGGTLDRHGQVRRRRLRVPGRRARLRPRPLPAHARQHAADLTLDIKMSTNRASLTKGAVATGTGTNVNNMFDDTEATNWTGLAPAAVMVTVDLQGGVQNVKRVNVSAMLNPENGGRFRALRQFEIWTCNGNAVTCALPTRTSPRSTPARPTPSPVFGRGRRRRI